MTKKTNNKAIDRKAKKSKVAAKNTKLKVVAADQMVIVGIGASAGGLEALGAIISGLPVQEDITYVIAQHLDPHHSTMLGSILERSTDIPIVELKTKQKLKPGTLHIIPPRK